ncbi:ATP-binding protein [Phascolarctobacterium faecium]|jgi:DNA mismatch repair enzyme (predicted ATPase)|uniref:ATP-binding protein n=1 Tax=Phascolarctobacterium faecium TaxID=33025 RepID=UPI00265FA44D|nr:ATP-binding protein [Phascolarctobacterium faecium]
MRYADMPPYAPTLMESTRAIGYSIEAAIADIIDNSIAANAARIDIDFFPIGQSYISILDDGHGMSEMELISAMQYGSRSPLDVREESDLGRYGLGMKTASLSQCRVLTVISKQNGMVAGAQWNLNHIKQAESWSLIVLDESEVKNFPNWDKLNSYLNGTLVVWQDLDKFGIGESDIAAAFTRKMNLIRDHLSLVFHRYLSGEPGLKKTDIRMNDLSIAPQDPFLIRKSTQLMDEETIVVRGEKVKVKPYILPHTSKLTKKELGALGGKEGLRKQQGFYVYRNKRLLIWGTWFRLMRQGDLSKLARVQVDIPNSLDDLWTLDIKKSTATPPEEVRKNLSVVIEKISEGSKRTWTYRGKKEVSDQVVHIWNRLMTRDGSIVYEVNPDHPMIDALVEEYPGIRPKIELILKQIAMSLPLNSLYIDLTNDEKLSNESEAKSSEIINVLTQLVAPYPAGDIRTAMINTLIQTEPFSAFIDEINDAMQRGEFND